MTSHTSSTITHDETLQHSTNGNIFVEHFGITVDDKSQYWKQPHEEWTWNVKKQYFVSGQIVLKFVTHLTCLNKQY